MPPPVVVHAPDPDGKRAVEFEGAVLGVASSLYDVMELLNGVGLNAAATAFEDPNVFEWRGGGPYAWEPGTARAHPEPPDDAAT